MKKLIFIAGILLLTMNVSARRKKQKRQIVKGVEDAQVLFISEEEENAIKKRAWSDIFF